MIITFNEDTLQINVTAGALEEYTPTDNVKDLVSKADSLQDKLKAKAQELQAEYKRFVEQEIHPESSKIKEEIIKINEENNPILAQSSKK